MTHQHIGIPTYPHNVRINHYSNQMLAFVPFRNQKMVRGQAEDSASSTNRKGHVRQDGR